jgi:hypothetical protein
VDDPAPGALELVSRAAGLLGLVVLVLSQRRAPESTVDLTEAGRCNST